MSTYTKPNPEGGILEIFLRIGLPAVFLASATIAVYWPATANFFINLDDVLYVQQNPHVQTGLTWGSMLWALCNPVIENWHPLTMWSYMLDYQLFGLNPWGFHFSNILFHGLNAVLVFLVLYQITRARWQSFWVALLFALHPLHVESVAWIAERKDVLSTFWGLLTLWAYSNYTQCENTGKNRSAKWKWYGISLTLFALSLMSKSMLVTLPCVLLLLDFWPLSRYQNGTITRVFMEKIPFFILAASVCVITYLLQKQGGAMSVIAGTTPLIRVENAIASYCRYLGKLFWPENLAIFYPYSKPWASHWVLLSGMLLSAISVAAFWFRQRVPYLFAGWFWFVGTLVPVIGLVQVGAQAMADRYTYFPSIGFFMALIFCGDVLSKNWPYRQIVLTSVGLAIAAVLLVITRQQISCWRNTETIFRHALAVTQDNYLAHQLLGGALVARGLNDEAIAHLNESVRLKPDYANAHYDLGVAYCWRHDPVQASRHFHEAIRLKPSFGAPHFNLGLVYFNQGRLDAAMVEFQEAKRLDVDYAAKIENFAAMIGQNNLAWHLATASDSRQRDGHSAVKLAETACQQSQYEVTITVGTLAAAYAEAGRFEEAVNMGQKALLMATDWGNSNQIQMNQKLIALYQNQRPYHESPAPDTADSK